MSFKVGTTRDLLAADGTLTTLGTAYVQAPLNVACSP